MHLLQKTNILGFLQLQKGQDLENVVIARNIDAPHRSRTYAMLEV